MSLEEDLSCPVCTEIFRDPVLLSCGHSFCRQCINDHWSSSRSRTCPVCRQLSPQTPVSNLSLRNTCESYLRETEGDGGHECQIHGEMIQLFCQTDQQLLCVTCKKLEHKWHKTQPLQQAVRQRKGAMKGDLRSAERRLVSLRNGTAQHNKIYFFIQSQVQQTERKLKEEFEKLHQFLRTEEESRIAALNEEEKEKGGKMKRIIQEGILSLSDQVRELKEGIEVDDITFLQNYHRTVNRAKCSPPDPELSLESLIDVSKHLGNLKYQVWEKMKDICPFYPVILNPNTAPPDVSVSDDLTSVTSVTSSVRRQNELNPLPLHRNRMVLGSVGYSDGDHMWEIKVGNSRHWTLGVCFGLEGKPTTQLLTPENGSWALRRDGDSYRLTPAGLSELQTTVDPEVVRVKLDNSQETYEQRRWRRVRFSDARSDSLIAEISRVPLENKLFPFVIAEDQSVPLCVVPAEIILTVDSKLSFWEKNREYIVALICFGFGLFIFGISLGNNDRQGR